MTKYLELTAEIVSAYTANNTIPAAELPDFISTVHNALNEIAKPAPEAKPARKPAVNPKKSIFRDYIISLEDGKQYKSLRRHLGKHGLTPEEYREKWNLPPDYPMVAETYSAARSDLAKRLGLGKRDKPKAKPAAAARRRK